MPFDVYSRAGADAAFATAAQGALADSATQPGDLGTAAAADVADLATAAQGAKADTAVQPADLTAYATAAQGAKADTAVQPADLSAYATDAELAAGLATKANTSHGHAIADTTGLQAALDGKQAAGSYAAALGADDNYVTDAEKAALHTHPAVIAQGATQADARAAIGAGTSSLVVGTGAGDAKAGNYQPTAADVDSGASSDGQVLTSDGAGGAAWEPLPPGVQGVGVSTVWAGSQAAYDAISTPDPNTLYFVTG